MVQWTFTQAAGAIGLGVLVDDDRGRERQLVARVMQDLLAQGLRHEHALRLICEVVIGIEGGPLRHLLEEESFKRSTPSPVAADTGTMSVNSRHFAQLLDDRQQPGLRDEVDLVQREDDRDRACFSSFETS